jgi:hypothetical protein
MPSIDINFLNNLKENYNNYNTFIETGTYNGNTILNIEPYFNNLYTIEFSDKYNNNTKNKYNGNKINFILGDSSIVFYTLLPTIKNNTIFFLDGHWSSGDTGKSFKDCPLIEEITAINYLFKYDAIIIIDDYRLFGQSPKTNCNEDWSDISKDKILDILKNRTTNIYHLDSDECKDDRLIIHIKSISI